MSDASQSNTGARIMQIQRFRNIKDQDENALDHFTALVSYEPSSRLGPDIYTDYIQSCGLSTSHEVNDALKQIFLDLADEDRDWITKIDALSDQLRGITQSSRVRKGADMHSILENKRNKLLAYLELKDTITAQQEKTATLRLENADLNAKLSSANMEIRGLKSSYWYSASTALKSVCTDISWVVSQLGSGISALGKEFYSYYSGPSHFSAASEEAAGHSQADCTRSRRASDDGSHVNSEGLEEKDQGCGQTAAVMSGVKG